MIFKTYVETAAAAIGIGVLALPCFCCSTCGGGTNGAIKGVVVNVRDGSVKAAPVAADVDLGPGGPGECDVNNLPGAGLARNLGTSAAPNIKWGTSRITISGSTVLVDGVVAAGWSWNSGSSTLVTADGRVYVFDSQIGVLLSSTGPSGLGTTTYAYDPLYTNCIVSATDRLGHVWQYGVDPAKPGPDYVIDPDGTHKVVFTYKASSSPGAGQYDVITVNKASGSQWIEQEHTSYSYNADGTLAGVVTVYAGDPGNPSTTSIAYQGALQMVQNSKLGIDTRYQYGYANIGGHQYRTATVQRTASFGSPSNSADQSTKYYYYVDSTGHNTSLFRQARQIFDGTNWVDYATTEYRVYTAANDTRFSPDQPLTSYCDALVGQPWEVIDARGNTVRYSYSADNGMPTSIVLPTPNNDYITYAYSQIGGVDSPFLSLVRDARGKYTRYTRDTSHPSLITQNAVSDDNSTWTTIKETSYYFSPNQRQGLPYQETIPLIDGTNDMATTYDYLDSYPSAGYHSSPTSETYSWYDPQTSSYQSAANTTSYYIDGRTRWSSDALGNQTDYTYDDESRPVDTQLPAEASDGGTITSSGAGQITDSSKAWVPNQLAGMLLVIGGGSYTVSSNSANTIYSVALPPGLARPYSLRPYTELHYNSCCGEVDTKTDQRGKHTYYEYDSAGRVTTTRNDVTGGSSTDPVIKYTYNGLGQKITMETYTANNTAPRLTAYTYDQLGRLIKTVYPYNSVEGDLLWDEYNQYDANGNVVAKLVGLVDGNGAITAGSVTAYGYDSINRLVGVKYSYSSSVWPVASDTYGNVTLSSADVSYTYDQGSSLKLTMTDASGTSSYTYDSQGRLSTYTPALPSNYRVQYSYNPNGDKTAVTVFNYSGGAWVNQYQTVYCYYTNAWLKQALGQTWSSGQWITMAQVDFSYDAAGNCTARNNNAGSDVQTAYTSNSRGETLSMNHGALYDLSYTRDGAGNPMQVAFSGSQFSQPYTNANTLRYAFDAAGQLTNQDWGYLTGSNWTSVNNTTWAYDWVGNRNPSSNAYNKADEFNSGNGYTYNMLGNVTVAPGGVSYTYTPDNLLATSNQGGSLTWDPDRQRSRLANGSSTWDCIYDPTASVPAVLLAKNTANSATNYMFYVRQPRGDLLASFDTAATPNKYYYHFDDIGNTLFVTDGGGMVSDSFTYDAWGSVLNAPANNRKPYQYVGQLGYYTLDSGQGVASNLMGLGVRFYDPTTGRFTQRDPAKSGWNVYVYADDDPATKIDPSGLCEGTFFQCYNRCEKLTTNSEMKPKEKKKAQMWCSALCGAFAAKGCTWLFARCTSFGDTANGWTCMALYDMLCPD